ncbi:unnamed protein product [Onchocerca flexuosa]|uniref:PID domain-containing protein n=1 Tax=Onchocerca flexuosa TaxID=387005 RepID=A0A183I6E2_9BILA|nr:unnamed protein product [Onchocerca flexuosa]
MLKTYFYMNKKVKNQDFLYVKCYSGSECNMMKISIMCYDSEDESVKDVMKKIVDMLCVLISNESSDIGTVISTNDHGDAKVYRGEYMGYFYP